MIENMFGLCVPYRGLIMDLMESEDGVAFRVERRNEPDFIGIYLCILSETDTLLAFPVALEEKPKYTSTVTYEDLGVFELSWEDYLGGISELAFSITLYYSGEVWDRIRSLWRK